MAADKMCTNGHFSSAKNAGRTCWCGAVIVGFAAALMAAQVEHRVTHRSTLTQAAFCYRAGPQVMSV